MSRLNFIHDAAGNLIAAEPDGEMPADRSAAALQTVATEVGATREQLTQALAALPAQLGTVVIDALRAAQVGKAAEHDDLRRALLAVHGETVELRKQLEESGRARALLERELKLERESATSLRNILVAKAMEPEPAAPPKRKALPPLRTLAVHV